MSTGFLIGRLGEAALINGVVSVVSTALFFGCLMGEHPDEAWRWVAGFSLAYILALVLLHFDPETLFSVLCLSGAVLGIGAILTYGYPVPAPWIVIGAAFVLSMAWFVLKADIGLLKAALSSLAVFPAPAIAALLNGVFAIPLDLTALTTLAVLAAQVASANALNEADEQSQIRTWAFGG